LRDFGAFRLGYSPDGLVGEDGTIECKSRRARFQVETIVARAMPADYAIQVQTGLLVSGRAWCDFVSYSGGLPMAVYRVHAAEDVQDAILRAAGEIPADMPIFLDSPMAKTATALYQTHRKLLRIPGREAGTLTDGVTLVGDAVESQRLTRNRWPKVIISASGMATGGRVLHHLKALAPHPRNLLVFPGFQVGGTRGATIIGGAPSVKIHGEYVSVKAEVSHLEGFSGHADADGLMAWLKGFEAAPSHCFVVHGEPAAADALRLRIQDELGWRVSVPEHGAQYEV
jgi:metallo-beta-lactamase family protein